MVIIEKKLERADFVEITKAILLNTVGNEFEGELINSETNLFEFGLDSMSIIDFVLALEDEFKFSIDEDDLSEELFLKFDNIIEYIISNSDI